MEAHLYLETFSMVEAEKRIDRLFVRLMWGHFLVSLLLAFWFRTFLPALFIGLPTAAVFGWLARNQPCGLTTRCAGGVGLMVFSALFIQQTHGLTEAHFHVFCALAFLLAYRDWRVIVSGAVTIAVHHLAFTILQLVHLPLFIYTSDMVNPWLLTLIHAMFVVFESSILVILAIGMRAEWERAEATGFYHDRMALVAVSIASGDLSQTVQPVSDKDVLGNAYVQMITNLSELVSKVQSAAGSIATASAEVATGNEDLSQRTEEQAASLEETAASMEEMAATVKQNADNSRHANQLAAQARNIAEKGGSVIGQAVSSMNEINVVTKRIADIITVIDEIAFQTNLLALNAAVEAARVGEQGRGFAVVAAEVRSLAGRSATAAKEIKGLVLDSVRKVQEGNLHVNQSGEQLQEIVIAVKKVADVIAEISAAGSEQAEGIEQVNKAVMQMDQITQQNAALVEEATAASLSMSQQAGTMLETVSLFKLDARYHSAQASAARMPVEMQATGTHGRAKSASGNRRPARTASTPKLTLSPARTTPGDNSNFEEF